MRAATVILAVLVLSGCGGSSEKEYRAALDKECAGTIAFNRSLPQRQHDQALSVAQIEALANAHAQASRERIRKLDHPGSLDDEAEALDRLYDASPDSGADRATSIAYLERFRAAYAALGATGCERGVAAGIKQFQSAPTP